MQHFEQFRVFFYIKVDKVFYHDMWFGIFVIVTICYILMILVACNN